MTVEGWSGYRRAVVRFWCDLVARLALAVVVAAVFLPRLRLASLDADPPAPPWVAVPYAGAVIGAAVAVVRNHRGLRAIVAVWALGASVALWFWLRGLHPVSGNGIGPFAGCAGLAALAVALLVPAAFPARRDGSGPAWRGVVGGAVFLVLFAAAVWATPAWLPGPVLVGVVAPVASSLLVLALVPPPSPPELPMSVLVAPPPRRPPVGRWRVLVASVVVVVLPVVAGAVDLRSHAVFALSASTTDRPVTGADLPVPAAPDVVAWHAPGVVRAIADGVAVVVLADPGPSGGAGVVARDATTGRERWHYLRQGWTVRGVGVAGGMVVLVGLRYASADQWVIGLDLRTGAVRWGFVQQEQNPLSAARDVGTFGRGSWTYVLGPLVMFGGEEGEADAYDAATGAHRFTLSSERGCTFADATTAGANIVVAQTCPAYVSDGRIVLTAIRPADGGQLWRTTVPMPPGEVLVAVGERNTTVVVSAVVDGGAPGPSQTTSTELDAATGRILGQAGVPDGLAVAGGVVSVSGSGAATALVATGADGRPRWTVPLGGDVDGGPVAADNRIYLTVDAPDGTERLRVLDGAGGRTLANPVVPPSVECTARFPCGEGPVLPGPGVVTVSMPSGDPAGGVVTALTGR